MSMIRCSFCTNALCRSGFYIALFSLSCLSRVTWAQADNWDVGGEHGELQVTGQLTEGACRLDMASAYQQINLGNITTGELVNVGDQGKPVAFQIRLRDCVRTESTKVNNRTGNLIWNANQPVVAMAFLAPTDSDTPSLIRVDGPSISGIGIHLMDAQHRSVRLGSWNRPQFIDPGQDELTFYVVTERTKSQMVAGDFRTTINFHLNYE
ncbi:fimbrial protein [Buttiauxella sp. B2]|uniref:fimbrial protein n=1 Tax=Buttiauxella sp. B2 TaxID=2587812 RepID=UPI00167879DC|nr:fimbrial protein [Buttiauxella sp. B2]